MLSMPLMVVATGKLMAYRKPLLRGNGAEFHQFATSAKTLHAQRSHTPTVGFWQNLSFEAAESRIAAVERHLNGVEGKIVRQHL